MRESSTRGLAPSAQTPSPTTGDAGTRSIVRWLRRALLCLAVVLGTCTVHPVSAQGEPAEPAAEQDAAETPNGMGLNPAGWLSRDNLPTTIPAVLVLSALSLAPAILLMTTCFVRIVVVLGLLRQALGLPQLPPTQVLTALAMFLTVLVMTPVWTDIYQEAVVPYQEPTQPLRWDEALARGVRPLRRFMSRQIEAAGNSEDVWLFYGYLQRSTAQATPATYDDVPLQALLPAFLVSELKVAFLIGFQIYLPFLVVDLVVAGVTTSMGMVMLPPGLVSLPLKLLLFVLLDGWHLVVGMLLQSIAPYS